MLAGRQEVVRETRGWQGDTNRVEGGETRPWQGEGRCWQGHKRLAGREEVRNQAQDVGRERRGW